MGASQYVGFLTSVLSTPGVYASSMNGPAPTVVSTEVPYWLAELLQRGR